MFDVLGFIVKKVSRITLEPKPSYTWNSYNEVMPFPVVEGYANLNGSKCTHKRRIMRELIRGSVLTSKDYADDYDHVDFRKRVSELRNEYGLNIQDVWVTPESGKRYKEYLFNTNEVVR